MYFENAKEDIYTYNLVPFDAVKDSLQGDDIIFETLDGYVGVAYISEPLDRWLIDLFPKEVNKDGTSRAEG